MKERPILFNAAMVRAILSGQKTQTRRVVKPCGAHHLFAFLDLPGNQTGEWAWCSSSHVVSKHIHSLYGQPGDQLWVRETFGHFERNDRLKKGDEIFYRADGQCIDLEPWRPSIHMPRWASRIQLEITAVRVERLNDISATDAISEGVSIHADHHTKPADSIYSPVSAYRDLWESINGAGSWAANPWVWVIEFKVMEGGAA